MNLDWEEDADDDDNTTHEAASEAFSGDRIAYYRIRPVLIADRVRFTLDRSSRIILDASDGDDRFDSLEEARAHCEALEDAMDLSAARREWADDYHATRGVRV